MIRCRPFKDYIWLLYYKWINKNTQYLNYIPSAVTDTWWSGDKSLGLIACNKQLSSVCLNINLQ